MKERVPNASAWAAATFAASVLPDCRLKKRLVRYAGDQAEEPAATTSAICKGDPAAREGAYRFLENSRVRPDGIEAGPIAKAKADCTGRKVILMIQDTTSASVKYGPLADEIRSPGSPTGFMVHTTLAVDGETGYPIGILDQQRWIRVPKAEREGAGTESFGSKESVRWQLAAQHSKALLVGGDAPFTGRIASVADREADIYSFLRWHIEEHIGFVIRSKHNRAQPDAAGRIWDSLDGFQLLGTREITIPQRGGQGVSVNQKERAPRKKRVVQTEIWARSNISIADPEATGASITVNAVVVREINPPDGQEPLQWRLLTDEPADTLQEALRVVTYYERRWIIEEFHKIWKTGCRVETRPLQDPETVERMLVITAAIGIRLLQLHRLANEVDDSDTPCDEILNEDEWHCLWATTEPNSPIPSSPPTARWAFVAIAKLGGWYDTKKSGRVGWQTIWRGWFKLQEYLVGWRAARTL